MDVSLCHKLMKAPGIFSPICISFVVLPDLIIRCEHTVIFIYDRFMLQEITDDSDLFNLSGDTLPKYRKKKRTESYDQVRMINR